MAQIDVTDVEAHTLWLPSEAVFLGVGPGSSYIWCTTSALVDNPLPFSGPSLALLEGFDLQQRCPFIFNPFDLPPLFENF